MNFLIGFEFEFGWLPNILLDGAIESKKVTKGAYFDTYVYKDVRKSLKNFLGSEFKNIREITEDPSLSFANHYDDAHFGVEVISKPMEDSLAINFCKLILKWMKQHPQIITNLTCSLHVNISSSDKETNKKLDYFSILSNTPQEEILERFKRTSNKYCQSTNTKKFGIAIDSRITKQRTINFWLKRTHQKSISVITNNSSILNRFSSKDLLPKVETLYFNNPENAKELIKGFFIDHLSISKKDISIVEKLSPTNKRYFEFRMIGNTDYHLRIPEIMSTIKKYKKALKNSIK
ncbi:hypothetical protein GW796_08510 [archaeon]|nr:hypothetical protein [archaeon]